MQAVFDPFALVDATWPARRTFRHGPWMMREGAGGGQRVSAATLADPCGFTEADIALAEAGMADLGQEPLFQIRSAGAGVTLAAETRLDSALAARGYAIVQPSSVLAGDAEPVAALDLPHLSGFSAPWPALAIQREIWVDGGIGPARVAVMDRAAGARSALLARAGDRPAGAGFIAGDGAVAMIHAVHVLPEMRRRGAARHMMIAAARWARDHGFETLALAVTRGNVPANALYASLGMRSVGEYHYRVKTD